MAEGEELANVDISRQTVRGRACPRCGGKIIPSDRAVYQAVAGGHDAFPLWQCERCGYEEMSEKRAAPAKPAHKKKGEE
jgi:ribosomal protein S27AE